MSVCTARDKSHWDGIYVPQLARPTYYLPKYIKNKNPNRSKLRGIFNVYDESKVTASSGVLDPSQTNKTADDVDRR